MWRRFLSLAGCLTASAAVSQEQLIATWNIGGAERSANAIARSLDEFEDQVGALDLLVLQEIVSEEQVEAAAEAVGMPYWAVSDFSPPVGITENPYASLEVAVLSRLPLVRAAEWDTTGRAAPGDGYPPRTSSSDLASEELEIPLAAGPVPSRGFLRVDTSGGLAIYAVHWKSSLGESCNAADIQFAEEREVQAAGIVHDAEAALGRGATVIVAGDFNIQAPGRSPRVGTDPGADCRPRGTCEGICGGEGRDGYDDSIAMLLAMDEARLLSRDMPETFIGRFFPGGAIDHILVAGAGAKEFGTART